MKLYLVKHIYHGKENEGYIRANNPQEAKEKIALKDYMATMDGIYTTSVNNSTIDEAPMAYKPAQEIIDAIKDTVKIKQIIKPIYNFKA